MATIMITTIIGLRILSFDLRCHYPAREEQSLAILPGLKKKRQLNFPSSWRSPSKVKLSGQLVASTAAANALPAAQNFDEIALLY